MTIYVDHCHMTATTLAELQEFARVLMLAPQMFVAKTRYPHYRICEYERITALRNRAQAVTSRQLFQHAKLCR